MKRIPLDFDEFFPKYRDRSRNKKTKSGSEVEEVREVRGSIYLIGGNVSCDVLMQVLSRLPLLHLGSKVLMTLNSRPGESTFSLRPDVTLFQVRYRSS